MIRKVMRRHTHRSNVKRRETVTNFVRPDTIKINENIMGGALHEVGVMAK
jgi:hypothetical protein